VWRVFQMEITWDPVRAPEVQRLPRKVKQRIEELHPLIHSAPVRVIDEVRELVRQYPHVACFRNWHCACLRILNRKGEAREAAEALFHDCPDYIFGRTTLAELMLEDADVEGAQLVMGGKGATLPSMYPKQRKFHISEVRHWFFVHGKLQLLLGRMEGARSCRDVLDQIEPGSAAVTELDRLLQVENFELLQLMRKFKERSREKAPPKTWQKQKTLPKVSPDKPSDHHPNLFAGPQSEAQSP